MQNMCVYIWTYIYTYTCRSSWSMHNFLWTKCNSTCFFPTDLAIWCTRHHGKKPLGCNAQVIKEQREIMVLEDRLSHWGRWRMWCDRLWKVPMLITSCGLLFWISLSSEFLEHFFFSLLSLPFPVPNFSCYKNAEILYQAHLSEYSTY